MMNIELILAIIAFIFVMLGLLFLSMIHLFMIPKDVMERDTTRQPHLEGRASDYLAAQSDGRDVETPEIPQDPNKSPGPEVEEQPRPEPEVEREPGQQNDPELDKEPPPRQA
jgi:hypothetical protein